MALLLPCKISRDRLFYVNGWLKEISFSRPTTAFLVLHLELDRSARETLIWRRPEGMNDQISD